ncbi:hypothetical protein ELH17_08280 [Rhizobium ruizarguesonis]|nr:hypothetical protein ELH17_08280 [Rhizobium ruizarguesonis]
MGATDCFVKVLILQRSSPARYGSLEADTLLNYLRIIGVAECSTCAFATAGVAYLLLTTDVLALV